MKKWDETRVTARMRNEDFQSKVRGLTEKSTIPRDQEIVTTILLLGEILDIDTSKIALLGESAGGHLAALVGMTAGIRRLEGSVGSVGHSSAVQAIVDIDGVLDLTHPSESGKDTIPQKPSAAKSWLGASYKEKPELWAEASPLRYVNAATPPIAFINSSIERFHAGRDELG